MAPAKKPAGYSGTPLVTKLGIKPDTRIQFFDPPDDFGETLGSPPDGLRHVTRGALDFAIVFVRRRIDLEKRFPLVRDRLEPNGTLWVGWPKKSARTTTDLTENVVREIGLDAGLVDVKVCAIDDTWSGLKFVRRIRDR
jgi:hypothetical protein